MASRSHKPNQNEELSSENNGDIDIVRNITEGIRHIDLSIDQLRREFHKSLDLNNPICDLNLVELNNVSLDNFYDKIETGRGSNMQETKESAGLEMEEAANEEDDNKTTNVDLSLSLSPSGVKSKDESSNQSEISSPSSQLSCMSLDINNTINEDLESSNHKQKQKQTADDDLPSLILMGCIPCHIFVMVSEAEPKCPNCMGSVLIDMFRESPAKRSRRNWRPDSMF